MLLTGFLTANVLPAQAAPVQGWDPGNIISDDVFFNPALANASQVQSFLEARLPSCAGTAPRCLRDYRLDAPPVPADAYCTAWAGGANLRAADVIAGVSTACGINPQVVLVMLQKEQGLVTNRSPDAEDYQKAMGYGCPDTAGCDTRYFGLYNQIYQATRRFQVYRAEPARFRHRAGATVDVYFHPDLARCGTSKVYLANAATAGLYNYTPYQPNAASLQAYPGTGDSCSSYGNRNFFVQFTSWFGSTRGLLRGAIAAKYDSIGGPSSSLGYVTSGEVCGLTNGGCGQYFQNGLIYWSPATGASVLRGAILDKWRSVGFETGALGYPTTDEICGLANGGCGQYFQGGMIYWSPATGAAVVSRTVLEAWRAAGSEAGRLGYPTSDELGGLPNGGSGQYFQGGMIYQTPGTGARVLTEPVLSVWRASGFESGPLGYPTSNAQGGLVGGGSGQYFQGGMIYHSPATGAQVIRGATLTAWRGDGWERGPLGYPTASAVCGLTASGCRQQFQFGRYYESPATGASFVRGAVLDAWLSRGGEAGPLGYPTTDEVCTTASSCQQTFQRGSISWTPAGAVVSTN